MTSLDPQTAIGIDFGGTSIKTGLVQGSTILKRGRLLDPQGSSATDTLEAMAEVVREISAGLPAIPPVGIGFPGLINSDTGIVHALSNVQGWNELHAQAILEQKLHTTVVLENDANAMAFGEWKYGNAKGARHVICITLGTGVGGGIILNGRLFKGAQQAAGELGHASIDFRGPRGPYSNGGLEEYVGNQQISERAMLAYSKANMPPPNPHMSPADLAHAAEAGCPVARELWRNLGDEIGAALANAMWLLNPDAIIIGGGVAKAGDLVFQPIRESIRNRTSKVIHENLLVEPACLGNDAGMIGCAALAIDAASRSR